MQLLVLYALVHNVVANNPALRSSTHRWVTCCVVCLCVWLVNVAGISPVMNNFTFLHQTAMLSHLFVELGRPIGSVDVGCLRHRIDGRNFHDPSPDWLDLALR